MEPVEKVVDRAERARGIAAAVAHDLTVEDPEEGHHRHPKLELAEGVLELCEVFRGQRVLVERAEARDAEAADEMAARPSEDRVRVHRLEERGLPPGPEVRSQ